MKYVRAVSWVLDKVAWWIGYYMITRWAWHVSGVPDAWFWPLFCTCLVSSLALTVYVGRLISTGKVVP